MGEEKLKHNIQHVNANSSCTGREKLLALSEERTDSMLSLLRSRFAVIKQCWGSIHQATQITPNEMERSHPVVCEHVRVCFYVSHFHFFAEKQTRANKHSNISDIVFEWLRCAVTASGEGSGLICQQGTKISCNKKQHRDTSFLQSAWEVNKGKTACVAQCQPEDFCAEKSEQTDNPSADFSIQEEGWLQRPHPSLFTEPASASPHDTCSALSEKPREEDIPQILPL